jgi:uncharacterized protein
MRSLPCPLRWLCLLVLLPLFACERAEPVTVMATPNGSRLELPSGIEPVEFATGTLQIHGNEQVHTLRIEIAETDEQRERGLMYRTHMPEDAGMLFIYPSEVQGGFWMFNTHIPLSLAYLNRDRVIFQIVQMEPCESEFATMCPAYPSRRPYQYGLEVNQGYFEARGIAPGARIVFQRD